MKVVMYHYVRRDTRGLPSLPYLDAGDFVRQLDFFERAFGIVKRDEFVNWVGGGSAPAGVLLTFDDGLRDHLEVVLPVLQARRHFGLFYVSSSPILTGKILDVHKVQLALGRLGGKAAYAWLRRNAPHLLSRENGVPAAEGYNVQSEPEVVSIKRLFNWQLPEEERSGPLDALFAFAFDGAPPDCYAFYMREAEIRTLSDAGMGIGAHGHKHLLSSRIAPELEKAEVDLSGNFIESVGGSRAWGYCHPFGSPGAFTEYGKSLLADAGFPFALAVVRPATDVPAEIRTPLARSERYSLPRNDCNAFPHGRASYSDEGMPREDGAVQ
jgi:peptidoglycan/xylan/chitin deacetylase (PgdA/CDA1 family)